MPAPVHGGIAMRLTQMLAVLNGEVCESRCRNLSHYDPTLEYPPEPGPVETWKKEQYVPSGKYDCRQR